MRLLSPVAISATLSGVAAIAGGGPEYEFVVIGSGAGGGMLAASLARKGHSVFLLEAGDDNGDEFVQQIPVISSVAAESTGAWHFFVEHYENRTQAYRDSKYTYIQSNGSLYVGLDPPEDAVPLGIAYPRGASLGGSTQINAMNLGPPPDHEWDHIVEVTGDESFRPDVMRDYFIELENCNYLPPGTPGHGFDGPITLSRNNISYVTDFDGMFRHMSTAALEVDGVEVESPEELADLLLRDPYPPGEYSQGAFSLVTATDEMKRRSSVRGYILDTINAKNEDGSPKYALTLSTNSLATRVLFDDEGSGSDDVPTANGVEYMIGEALYAADPRYDASSTGELKTVAASREVIVSGGSFNTPQILKLSGVGPREELESLNISVVADVPGVGAFLQDNYEAGVIVDASTEWENHAAHCTFQLDAEDPCFDEWLNNGTGPYGEAAAPVSMIYRSDVSDNEHPDVFLYGFSRLNFPGIYPGLSQQPPAPFTFSWEVAQMPGPGDDSQGYVKLRSTNPRDTPLIQFNYLEGEAGERDLDAILAGAELVLSIFNATGGPGAPFTRIHPDPAIELRQGLKDEMFAHHASSSCRMGRSDDPGRCADSEFRVNGVRGLRVVDTSVFPRTPAAWPTVPTYMIGLKAAELLAKEAAGCRRSGA